MKLVLDEFIKFAAEHKEIGMKQEVVNGETLTIFCYNIATPNLFDTELARECRGVVFDSEGKCICRPLKKFFNIGERTETLPGNIDWDSLSEVTTKIDGSLITPVMIKGEVFFKTKKTFYSSIAVKLNKMWQEKGAFYEKYFHMLNSYDLSKCTLLFEYISKDNVIVIDYDKEDLIFLGERSIADGKFYPSVDIIADVIPSKTYAPIWNYNSFIEKVVSETGKEGYVIYGLDHYQAYKIKTQWYMDRHHLLSSLSYRNILKMIVEARIDDIISELRIKGFTKQVAMVEEVYKEYSSEWDELYSEMLEVYNYIMKERHLSKKEFAMIVNRSYRTYQAMLFNIYDNNMERLAVSVQDMIVDKLKEKYKGRVIFLGEVQ